MKFRNNTGEKLNVKAVNVCKSNLEISFDDNVLNANKIYSIVMKKDKEDSIWTKEASNVDLNHSKLVFDMTEFSKEIAIAERVIWSVFIEVSQNDQTKRYILNNNHIKKELRFQDKKHFNRLDRMSEPFARTEIEIKNEKIECIAFAVFDEKAELCVISVNEANSLQHIIMGKVLKVEVKKDIFRIKIRYPKSKYQFKQLVLKYRTKKEADEKEYVLCIDAMKEKKDNYIICASIDFKTIDFKSLCWDLYFMVDDGEKEVRVSIRNKDVIFKLKYFSLLNNNVYKFGNGMLAFPYITLGDTISFECREIGEYDGVRFKLIERLACIRYILSYFYLKRQKIWLVFEKYCYMAQDNGFYFFKYCMDNNMEQKLGRKIYYVMDKNSPDRKALEPYKDHVLDFMSIRHITYLLAARVFISTDAKIHAYASKKRGSILDRRVRKRKLVFLQHGVTAFKKVDNVYGKGRRGECNLFVVTSDYEKDIIANNFRYKNNEIAVTGFARWDVLKDKSAGSKEILLMPTWRNWLDDAPEELFKQSNYYINYMKLLNAPHLQEILEKYDLTLNFYIHPRFNEYFNNFIMDVNRIKFIPFGKEPLNELLMNCRMLITDYSSVAWDTYYQNKPVVFYQFDLNEYNETHGSYVDMEQDLFGERMEEIDPLINLIEEYVNHDFKLKSEYETMRENCFKYVDTDNSKRICEHIIKKGW